MYLPISVTGFTVYGSAVTTDILGSVSDSWLKTTVQILFASHLFFAFLIIMNPVSQELESFVNIPQRKYLFCAEVVSHFCNYLISN